MLRFLAKVKNLNQLAALQLFFLLETLKIKQEGGFSKGLLKITSTKKRELEI
jgi:hypothetical protein